MHVASSHEVVSHDLYQNKKPENSLRLGGKRYWEPCGPHVSEYLKYCFQFTSNFNELFLASFLVWPLLCFINN